MENGYLKSRKFWLAVAGVAISFGLILGGGILTFAFLQNHVSQFYWGLISIILGYMGVNGLINIGKDLFKK